MSQYFQRGAASTARGVGHLTLAGLQFSLGFVVTGVRIGIRRTQRFPVLPELPEGRVLELPDRGRAVVYDTGAPTPDAPTVLLLHGLATTGALCWYGVLDSLRATHRVVLFDQRWHGRGITSERFSLEECADDAAAVLDALEIERAIVVGYSMGGALAQVIAHRHPDRLAGLVLCSTAAAWIGSLGDRAFYPFLHALNDRIRPFTHSRVAARAAGLPPVPAPPSGDLSAWAWAEFRSTSAWSLPEALGELGRFDARAWLPDVTVPSAVVVTARDRAIPTRRQREMAALLPDCHVFESPGGHASIVFDTAHWLPQFVAAVEDVVGRARVAA
ncbi:alpha/beta fold hydrolase [Nocardioides sp. R-C-SC26]|uniref:alpha/beta fold hydrolase n=1 Tax=Nocardioides sp. R-C-SC26 TaxID=2870414 RepID=UPI001E6013C8|nr:alpha/beta fold hydrolase [Nocardioides sp. R-C-SC26]